MSLTNMQVVGMTTQQYVYIASKERKFRINEILVIEDNHIGGIKGEVIETQSFNKFIPLTSEKNSMIDSKALEGLRQVGFSVDDEEVNLAKVRTLSELSVPVKTGSSVRIPQFSEIEKMLIQNVKGWMMGVLRGTEEVAEDMPDNLKNKGVLFDPNQNRIITIKGVPFLFDYKSMYEYPHVGIFGGSGSGKSYASRVLLEELMKVRIPAIVWDPHFEMEFKDNNSDVPNEFQKDYKRSYEVLTLGKEIGIDFTDLSTNDLVNILGASSGGITENMDNAIRTLHDKNDTFQSFAKRIDALVYGIDNKNELDHRHSNRETLSEEERVKVEYQKQICDAYSNKISNSAGLKGIQWRLNRLQGFGLFKNDIRPVIEGLKGRKLIVIRGSIEHLKIFSAYLLKKTYSMRRDYKDKISQGIGSDDWFPPFINVMDEAHNFAPKGYETPTKSVVKEIAQEGRKYGSFLIFATQRPSLLDDTIMAQLNTKFIFRTVRGQDIKSLSEETDMTGEESARLPYLPSGECFVSSAVIGRTVAVRIRAAVTKSPNSINPFDELEDELDVSSNPLTDCILNLTPISETKLFNVVKDIERQTGAMMTVNELRNRLQDLVAQGALKENQNIWGSTFERTE